MLSMTDRRMLRVTEAAAYLALSVSFLNKLRCSGGGPVFRKVGRAVLYHPTDLDVWLASHRRSTTSDISGGGN